MMQDFVHEEEAVRSTLAAIKPNVVQSSKEVIRHALIRTRTDALLTLSRRLKGFQKVDSVNGNAKETFERIYEKGNWRHGNDRESLSGSGSEVSATLGLVQRIEHAMRVLGCSTLLDVGCGDWNWMRRETFGFHYIGVDIVPDVIARNRQFERANVRFDICNVIDEAPPKADAALCREVLFHLSFADIRRAVANISKSTRLLCATTDHDILFNSDIRTGDFRAINLMRAPFSFPMPIAIVRDYGSSETHGRFLGIWETSALLKR
jgi:SAM-dependent methyltransferase